MPINSEHLASLTDADVVDQHGDKVGGVGQIYLDDASGQPAWVSVKSGLFGLRESFAPLAGAEVVDGNIQVPYAKDFIKDSPRIDAENHLDDSQQAMLYEYYGVDRHAAAPVGDAGGADRTASFASERVSEDLHDARTDGEDDREAQEDAEDEARTHGEFADGQPSAPSDFAADQADAGAGPIGGGPTDAAAIGAAAAVAARGTQAGQPTEPADAQEAAPITVEEAAAADGNAEWAETQQAHYQQANPRAQADWAAEQTPEEPVATDWSVPSTDPAQEEPTQVSRSGYSPDQPAAHSSAYEGHGSPAAAATGAAAAATGAAAAATGAAAAAAADGTSGTDTDTEAAPEATDAGAVTDDAGAGYAVADGAGADDVVTDDVGTDDVGTDDAVTGAAHQTGTGYPAGAESEESLGGAEGAVAGAAAAGAVAGGIAASDTETTAYEVPGAEQGTPITDVEPGAELAVDTEDPADGLTMPAEDTLAAGTDAGAYESGEPGVDEAEVFGAEGYQPDRDGTEMTDEERERLNQARGAL